MLSHIKSLLQTLQRSVLTLSHFSFPGRQPTTGAEQLIYPDVNQSTNTSWTCFYLAERDYWVQLWLRECSGWALWNLGCQEAQIILCDAVMTITITAQPAWQAQSLRMHWRGSLIAFHAESRKRFACGNAVSAHITMSLHLPFGPASLWFVLSPHSCSCIPPSTETHGISQPLPYLLRSQGTSRLKPKTMTPCQTTAIFASSRWMWYRFSPW